MQLPGLVMMSLIYRQEHQTGVVTGHQTIPRCVTPTVLCCRLNSCMALHVVHMVI